MKRWCIPAALLVSAVLLAACGSGAPKTESAAPAAAESVSEAAESVSEAVSTVSAEAETEVSAESSAQEAVPTEEEAGEENTGAVLEDGVYSAAFDTDSSMFRVNESCGGRGTLTVENGEMTIHITLLSKKIVNLYPGLAADAKKDGAVLLEPTVDHVTYDDGYEEDVYGFDVPVPVIDEEFDLALIGKKNKWYDHKVIVSDPQKIEG